MVKMMCKFLVSGINGADSWFQESMVKMVQRNFSLISGAKGFFSDQ
jgi:hypothetical protein